MHPRPIRPYKWLNLLANLELRRSFGAAPAPSAAYTEAQKRARQVVVKTMLSGLSHLPVGARADRMVELIFFQEETPTVTTLRPVLATASQMSTRGQKELAWMLDTWEKRPVPISLRPLRTELERLAANAALHPDLRKAAIKVNKVNKAL
ncbi:MAG: hypothetical protein V4671_26435 [Armatimonadota bacterium]